MPKLGIKLGKIQHFLQEYIYYIEDLDEGE